jgi:aarF domain-containing kinase
MRSSGFSALPGLSRPIQSRRVQSKICNVASRNYSYGRRPIRIAHKAKPTKAVRIAATSGTLAGSLLFFTDEIKYGYDAAERTGRVMTTLAVCINE